ncbi:hypothetical protein [Nocardioides sp. Arc9.136]|uniref:hypothetical protein n=1 Tax=Nocardioides sp. Arc9.136 TaxID=2996826 RepID=UPI002665A0C4|nr:hypothetical protein [Nocardioides sp. Arc9.136]WKN47151.1 hypothetical protein OSR43_13995 [Nocardioides sp. Arc9.136]
MTEQNLDQSISDAAIGSTVPEPTAATARPANDEPRAMLTMDELLASARRPRDYAGICLRADLEADHTRALSELRTIVDAQGRLLDDAEHDETTIGEISPTARARALSDRVQQLEREMAASKRWVLFEGMSSDDLSVFNDQHKPKGDRPDMTRYNTRLIAKCAIDPVLTIADVESIRKNLGPRAVGELVRIAHKVNTDGGVDVPFSPAALQNLGQR